MATKRFHVSLWIQRDGEDELVYEVSLRGTNQDAQRHAHALFGQGTPSPADVPIPAEMSRQEPDGSIRLVTIKSP